MRLEASAMRRGLVKGDAAARAPGDRAKTRCAARGCGVQPNHDDKHQATKEYGTMIKGLRLSATTLLAFGTLALSTNSASAASNQVPFGASFSGNGEPTSETTISWAGTGHAMHMGYIANEGQIDITGPDSSCPGGIANVNVETLIAGNGDTLTITSQDVACPTGPAQFHGTGLWTVTGGTGRFGGATGQGSSDGSGDFNTGTFTMTLTGTLVRGAAS